MKKLFAIISFTLLLCLSVSIGLCFCIIPEQTKLAMDVVVEWVNKPLPIIGVSILTLGGVVLVVLNRTTLGRKLLTQLKEEIGVFKRENEKLKQEIIEKEKELITHKQEQIAFLSNYSQRIDKLTENIVKVCETSPNAKIKALGEEIKGIDTKLKEELDKKVIEMSEYTEEGYKSLETQIAELTERLNSYGKEEERTND